MNGYANASTFHTRCFSRGTSATAHHVAQQMCTLGIAANWFDTLAAPPELNDQNAGSCNSVSKNPYDAGSNRGGVNGYSEKPISASPVAIPSVLRNLG